MSATGAAVAPTDPAHLLTTTTGTKTTSSGSDVLATSLFNGGEIHAIYCCTSGNLAVKRVNDSGFTPYPVTAGQYLYGRFLAVGGTGSGTDANMVWIPEV